MNAKRIIQILSVGLCIGAGTLFFVPRSSFLPSFLSGRPTFKADGINQYVPEFHKAFIKKQFNENWFLLVEPADFDVDFMLDTHTPGKHYYQDYSGKLKIIALHADGKPVGFGTYYMLNSLTGRVQFIAVDKDARGKRYADQLVNYAIADLKKLGAKVVRLATRTTNTTAHKVYTRLGFEVVGSERDFNHYRKEI